MGDKTTVMLDRETLEVLRKIKREKGFSSIDEVIKWLIIRERRLRLLNAVEQAWSERLSQEELDKLIEAVKKLRRSSQWLTR